MADLVHRQAQQLERQLRLHLDSLLCCPSLLTEPNRLQETATLLQAVVPTAEALAGLTIHPPVEDQPDAAQPDRRCRPGRRATHLGEAGPQAAHAAGDQPPRRLRRIAPPPSSG